MFTKNNIFRPNRHMKILLPLATMLLLSSCSSHVAAQTDAEPDNDIVFFDTFDTFNESVWTKESHEPGWVNQELQSYRPEQVSVGKDGDKSVLIITASRKGDKFVSGRINSKGKKSFHYGTIQASIKLPPCANGLWPAFWMMGDNSLGWPACGEIDIMEIGDMAGIADGTTASRVNTAIHYGPTPEAHEQQYYATSTGINLQDDRYHTYTLRRTKDILEIKVDNFHLKTFDISDNPYFHDNFYILFNMAVGGEFTGILEPTGITALKDGEQVKMLVDWVKVTN